MNAPYGHRRLHLEHRHIELGLSSGAGSSMSSKRHLYSASSCPISRSWLATALCYLNLAVSGVPKAGTTQSSYTAPFHIGDGQQMHHLWGEESQKGKNSNKNKGERCIGVSVT